MERTMNNFLKEMTFSIVLFLVGATFTFFGLSGEFRAGDYSFSLMNVPARIVASVFGVILVGFSLSIEKQKIIVGDLIKKKTASEKESESITASPSRQLPGVECVNANEQKFLEGIDLSKVKRLSVLGHTGRRIFDEVYERIGHLPAGKRPLQGEIRLLTRTPIIEGLYRNGFIHETVTKVNALRREMEKIDIRFYEAVPSVRGIICEYFTGERTGYLTSYYWPQPSHSKAFDFAYVIKDKKDSPSQRPEASLLESWIDHYWGRDEIHTVVFDFDDTLVASGEVQVKAWVQVISDYLDQKVVRIKNISSRLRGFIDEAGVVIDGPALTKEVKKIFWEKQQAEAIIQDVFVGVKEETLKQINQRRYDVRKGMMDQARLFDGVEKLLEELSAQYNFAIISSTDEEMICKYLAKKQLLKYFPVVLGKNDPGLKLERERIDKKASLLIKLSEIIGIPLSRLVYIGDNNADYLATKQLQIPFIEARQAAKLMGKESLIESIDPKKPPLGHFDSFENETLPSLLGQYSRNVAEEKYQSAMGLAVDRKQ
jgi:phosphoglycolate phosphatase-like HAD superfamily hydrolase